MPLFRRGQRVGGTSTADPAESFRQATHHWALLTECGRPFDADATVHLTEAIRFSQIAASGGVGEALPLLAAAYLVAASVLGLKSIPSDAAARFAGLAAAAVTSAALLGDPDEQRLTHLGHLVAERYKVVRGRLRGSVYVPRDVESAFAGEIDGLRVLAFDADHFKSIRELFIRGVAFSRTKESRATAAGAWQADDTDFLKATLHALNG